MPRIYNLRILRYLRFIKYCDLKIKKIILYMRCICRNRVGLEAKQGQKGCDPV